MLFKWFCRHLKAWTKREAETEEDWRYRTKRKKEEKIMNSYSVLPISFKFSKLLEFISSAFWKCCSAKFKLPSIRAIKPCKIEFYKRLPHLFPFLIDRNDLSGEGRWKRCRSVGEVVDREGREESNIKDWNEFSSMVFNRYSPEGTRCDKGYICIWKFNMLRKEDEDAWGAPLVTYLHII